jgi:hypothetical protein
MMPEAYCALTDLLVASCAHCKGIPDVSDRPGPADYGPWFTARRDGRCGGCPAPVLAGDQIRADGRGGYLCESCGEAS